MLPIIMASTGPKMIHIFLIMAIFFVLIIYKQAWIVRTAATAATVARFAPITIPICITVVNTCCLNQHRPSTISHLPRGVGAILYVQLCVVLVGVAAGPVVVAEIEVVSIVLHLVVDHLINVLEVQALIHRPKHHIVVYVRIRLHRSHLKRHLNISRHHLRREKPVTNKIISLMSCDAGYDHLIMDNNNTNSKKSNNKKFTLDFQYMISLFYYYYYSSST